MRSSPVHRTMQLLNHVHGNMATNTMSVGAPWRSSFLSHVKEMDMPIFTLSTLHAQTSPELDGKSQLVPRARTVVMRGLLGSLPHNPRNPAPLNPEVFESDLLTITTDERMEKVPELLDLPGTTNRMGQSGSGGPVEAVFWAPKAKTQWRLRGRAFVIGPDIEGDEATSVRKALEEKMRRVKAGPWSWARELTAHFGNLSPLMRGSFRNPPPGTPITQKPEDGYSQGQKVEDLEDKIARKHFCLVVIVPEEVDQVDLSDSERSRRWNFQLKGKGERAQWTTTELWP